MMASGAVTDAELRGAAELLIESLRAAGVHLGHKRTLLESDGQVQDKRRCVPSARGAECFDSIT